MKFYFTMFSFLGMMSVFYGQNINAINAGAGSNNNLIYAVAEVYVLPVDSDDSSSGIVGVVSRIEFTTLGIDEVEYDASLHFYPNPTTQWVYFETKNESFDSVSVFDVNGKLVLHKRVIENKVDLSDLHSGTYFVKTSNPRIPTFKILKK
uniref:T9SS type A sorting domain-containing protein n=1 Tax=Flavobacterium sp. TaxID=239 RepID=UPI0040498505